MKTISASTIYLLKKGDEASFRLIYEELGGPIYNLSVGFLKDKAWSEEIVQEVFLRLWLNREKLDENGNMWLYLYVLAKRLCLNKLREIRRSKESFDQLMITIERISLCTQNDILKADLERYVDGVVSLLPERQQVIYKLSRSEGLSHKEISEKLGISSNTVKNHLVEALKTLKKSLQETDYLYFFILFYYLNDFFNFFFI